MKKVIFSVFLIVTFLSYLYVANSGTSKPWYPRGASWRIDRHFPTPPSETGSWIEISRHKDVEGNLTWGQSACYDPGNSCHRNDWFTWWYSIVSPPPKPEPQNEYESIYLPCVPTGYNSETGEYICE
ncbi:hypothetical protein D9V84_08470 [Bacteroidetes/Chlorobi group bacterium Naka2016]|jgi:hypothetical protein|nr:MAG: hypothetical protein D9V84_08470 [Bacteroidetes/Chlorobi group bacterium Naka2016]